MKAHIESDDKCRIAATRMSSTAHVASPSGVELQKVEEFIGQFEQVRQLMDKMNQISIWERIKLVAGLGG